MKRFTNIANDQDTRYKLSDTDRKHLLELDEKYKILYQMFQSKWNVWSCVNYEEEQARFLEERKHGRKYYPQLQVENTSLKDTDFLLMSLYLMDEFNKFFCFLSPYYVNKIQWMHDCAMVLFFNNQATVDTLTKKYYNKPTFGDFVRAMDIIREHPFIKPEDMDGDNKRHLRNEDVISILQKHVDERGFRHDIKLNKNLVARMNVVCDEPVMWIRQDCDFSDIDIESLKVHEIDTHMARRYYGYKSGLWLFVDGLFGRNFLDEGLAIYNSLNKNPLGVKPNLLFETSIKCVIGYLVEDLDFCELYDQVSELCPNTPDNILFKNLVRFKRDIGNCEIKGTAYEGWLQTDYFLGWQYVSQLPEMKREELIRYNIGKEQINDIENIKEFFAENKFKSLI